MSLLRASFRFGRLRRTVCANFRYSSGSSVSTSDSPSTAAPVSKPDVNTFFEGIMKLRKAGKENPIRIPSFEEKRLIGCICQQDDVGVNYMWIHKGEVKCCQCGCYFHCVDAAEYLPDLKE